GSLQVLAPGDDPDVAAAAARALHALLDDGRFRELVVTKVDGEAVAASPFREQLIAAGFVAGYRGLVLRAERRAATGSSSAPRGWERTDSRISDGTARRGVRPH